MTHFLKRFINQTAAPKSDSWKVGSDDSGKNPLLGFFDVKMADAICGFLFDFSRGF